MSGPTLQYIFNISILIGFVIPLLNLLSGWIGSLLGGGGDLDTGVDTGLDVGADASLDIGLDAGLDVSFDAGFVVGADALLDVGLDAGSGLSSGAGPDMAAGIATGGANGAGSGVSTSGHGGFPVPFNMMCLCLALVVFGATGKMLCAQMTAPLRTILLLIACLVPAGFSYWALYTFLIRRLKENDASALSWRELRGMGGEVTLRITGDSMGTIALRDKTGASISFRAEMDPHLKDRMPEVIAKGEPVVVTEVDEANKICYVSVYQHKLTGGSLT